MNAKFENGQKWHALALKLIDLWQPIAKADHATSECWTPSFPPQFTDWEDRYTAWRELEQQHIPKIHAAAKALIRTTRPLEPEPAVLYFLRLRLRASLDHVHAIYAFCHEQPVSLAPFPPLQPDDYAEWLMTEWSDDHAIHVDFPCGVTA